MTRYRILHLIVGLQTGGAEIMLYKLLTTLDRTRFEGVVVSLMDRGTLGDRIEALGVPVYNLGMSTNSSKQFPLAATRLRQLIRHLQPDLIQGWMYHANLATLLANKSTPVLWNIRHSIYNLKNEKKMTAAIIRLGAFLSGRPAKIIYNAQTCAYQHETFGYDPEKRCVIPNGFDCENFRPLSFARPKLRQELNVPTEAILIGLIARYHPMKDHANFIQAASIVARCWPTTYFVMAGREVTDTNSKLMAEIRIAGLELRVRLLGERTDVSEMIPGLDIVCSSSYGEGFPNVIGEAMSCGVPCVVTDVGDSAWLVEDTGLVVPPCDNSALAQALNLMLEIGPSKRTKLGEAARQRIINHFSLRQVTSQYEQLYMEVLKVV